MFETETEVTPLPLLNTTVKTCDLLYLLLFVHFPGTTACVSPQ